MIRLERAQALSVLGLGWSAGCVRCWNPPLWGANPSLWGANSPFWGASEESLIN